MMSKDFDLLSDRRRYASNRRASLFSHYSTNDKFYRYVELLSLEVDIEGYLKRKIGFSEWDRKWDLGVFRENYNKDQLGHIVKYYGGNKILMSNNKLLICEKIEEADYVEI